MINILKTYWKFTKGYKILILISILLLIVAVFCDIYLPILFKDFVNILILGNNNDNIQQLYNVFYLIVIILLIEFLNNSISWYLDRYIISNIEIQLNKVCFTFIHKHSYNFFTNNLVGSIANKIKNFIRGCEDIYYSLTAMILHILYIITVLITLAFINIYLLIIILVFLIFTTVINIIFGKIKYKLETEVNKQNSIIVGSIVDTLSNNINIKIFNNYKYEKNKFINILQDFYLKVLKIIKMEVVSDSAIFL